MDSLFFHPKLVHLPMALAVLVPLVAGGLALAWWRGWLPRRAWWIAVGLQVLLVGSSIAALRSGERDEEKVERVVPEAAIEAHEEAAEVFTLGAGITLGLMVLAGVLGGRMAAPAVGLALLGAVVGIGLGVRTGEAGGALVYRHGAAAAHMEAAGAAGPAGPAGEAAEDADRRVDEGHDDD